MKRIPVMMEDPVFAAGEMKTAVAPITILPSGLNCEVELFLGSDDQTKVASSGLISFISTGSQQMVSIAIQMPSPGGALYHVYLDVSVEGTPILGAQGIEDVIIPTGSVGPIVWE